MRHPHRFSFHSHNNQGQDQPTTKARPRTAPYCVERWRYATAYCTRHAFSDVLGRAAHLSALPMFLTSYSTKWWTCFSLLNTTWFSNPLEPWEEDDDEFMARAAKFATYGNFFKARQHECNQLNEKKEVCWVDPVLGEAPAILRLSPYWIPSLA